VEIDEWKHYICIYYKFVQLTLTSLFENETLDSTLCKHLCIYINHWALFFIAIH